MKLIDVYPEKGQKSADDIAPAKPNGYIDSLNGCELPIAMEVRRGRYLHSYEHPEALTPNHPAKWEIPLRDHDHVFLKGIGSWCRCSRRGFRLSTGIRRSL